MIAVPVASSGGSSAGGDGPLPGTAAGSVGAESTGVAADESLPLAAVVDELSAEVAVLLELPEPVELDELSAVADVSDDPIVDVICADASPLDDTTLGVVDDESFPVATVPLTVAVVPAPTVVDSWTLEASTVLFTGVTVVAVGAGPGVVESVIGEGVPPSLVTVVTGPFAESARWRTAGCTIGVALVVVSAGALGVFGAGGVADVSIVGSVAAAVSSDVPAGAPMVSSTTGGWAPGFAGAFEGVAVVY